jgi:DNA-binding MarR family transcriptional regulator
VSSRNPARRQPAADEEHAVVENLMALSRLIVGLTARTVGELDVDVTLGQYRALVVLATKGRQRTGELAAELGVQPSTATRKCNRLVNRGLIARERHPDDLRVSWLTLTSEGHALVAAMMLHRRAKLEQLAASAQITAPGALATGLAALVHAGGEGTEPDWPAATRPHGAEGG